MLAVLMICLSSLFCVVATLRSRDRRNKLVYVNNQLKEYFNRKSEMMLSSSLQKALLLAAKTQEQTYRELMAEKKVMLPLYNDRVIGLETWQRLRDMEKELDLEGKEIRAEAQELRSGWEDKIFDEVNVLLKKSVDEKVCLKYNEDALFNKKREILTKELRRKMEVMSAVKHCE